MYRIACGYVYTGLAFGVMSLSGSLYLNMFLMGCVEAPAQVLVLLFNNVYVFI
jgi:hypothetical protein